MGDQFKYASNGRLGPHLVQHASPLPRLSHPPDLHISRDRVLLGYMGTVDLFRGVDQLLEAMRFLPDNYRLRLVGRIPGRSESGDGPQWLDGLLGDPQVGPKVELVPRVPVAQVAGEIDRCDILLQPASSHPHTAYYASPLKSFDYMVRGKPIVAADVPCHIEMFEDGVNARLYRHDDPQHLADSIKSLVNQPRQANAIALGAWAQSAESSYPARASEY